MEVLSYWNFPLFSEELDLCWGFSLEENFFFVCVKSEYGSNDSEISRNFNNFRQGIGLYLWALYCSTCTWGVFETLAQLQPICIMHSVVHLVMTVFKWNSVIYEKKPIFVFLLKLIWISYSTRRIPSQPPTSTTSTTTSRLVIFVSK